MLLGREPALWATTLAVIAQAVILFVWGRQVDTTAWVPILTMVATALAGLFTRHKVIPTKTVREAGLSPEAVKRRAENPTIAPHEGP